MEIAIKILIYIYSLCFLFKEESILINQYYSNKRFIKTIYETYKSKLGSYYLFTIFVNVILSFFLSPKLLSFLILSLLTFNIFIFKSLKFKFTRRSTLLLLISYVFLMPIFFMSLQILNYLLIFSSFILTIYLIAINYLEYPLEIIIRKKYINAAKRKLAKMKNVKIIAITGSYGKTSLKYYLYQVLSYKYKVRATKGSVNTLMGLTKFINNEVEEYDEILILEAGVDSLKGMDKILTLFAPDIGVLTSIGPMHLATFKSEDNIFFEKRKLLNKSKVGYYCLDNEYLKKRQKSLENYHFYSLDEYFISYQRTKDGLLIKYKNNQNILIPLYGVFTLSSLSAVIKIAFSLGFKEEEIINILTSLKGEKHRLEKRRDNNLLIIDDAYNGNEIGIKEGSKTILCFDGKKAIITPGVIELGNKSYQINYRLGKELVNLDLVIIVSNNNSHPLKDGYLSNNGDKNKIIIVKSFLEGYKIVKKMKIDVLLIANDTFKTFLK